MSAGISIFLSNSSSTNELQQHVTCTLKKTPPKKRVFVMATSASSIRSSIRIPFLFFPPFLRSSSTVYPFDPFRARRKGIRKIQILIISYFLYFLSASWILSLGNSICNGGVAGVPRFGSRTFRICVNIDHRFEKKKKITRWEMRLKWGNPKTKIPKYLERLRV